MHETKKGCHQTNWKRFLDIEVCCPNITLHLRVCTWTVPTTSERVTEQSWSWLNIVKEFLLRVYRNEFSSWTDTTRLGTARLGTTRLGTTRLGTTRLGMARLGTAQLGAAQLGSARFGWARHATVPDGTTNQSHSCKAWLFFVSVPNVQFFCILLDTAHNYKFFKFGNCENIHNFWKKKILKKVRVEIKKIPFFQLCITDTSDLGGYFLS